MRELEYTSRDGTVIDLNADDLWVADLQEMRGYAWTYTLATRGIKSVSRNASTAKMTVRTKTPAISGCSLRQPSMLTCRQSGLAR